MGKISKKKRKAIHTQPRETIDLTERDFQIFESLKKHRVLTAYQLYQLHFPSLDRSQRRLSKLARFKYLHVIRHYDWIEGGGSKPYVYMLDRKGAAEVDATWHYSYKDVGSTYLRHAIPINDFMATVHVACDRGQRKVDSPYKVSSWTTEAEFKKNPLRTKLSLKTGASRTVRFSPDTFFLLGKKLADGRLLAAPCFIEWDGTTQPRRVIQEKVKNYIAYYKNGDFKREYKYKTMFVLFISGSYARIENLREYAEDLRIDGMKHFWFGRLQDLSPETVFSEPVWTRAGFTGKHALMPVKS